MDSNIGNSYFDLTKKQYITTFSGILPEDEKIIYIFFPNPENHLGWWEHNEGILLAGSYLAIDDFKRYLYSKYTPEHIISTTVKLIGKNYCSKLFRLILNKRNG